MTMATKTAINSDLPLKLGKTPARPDAVGLKFAAYLDKSVLTPPVGPFGQYALVKQYPMYSNDKFGCCVWSGDGHETQLAKAMGHGTVSFTDANILAAYSAVTGFDIDDPSTDQGTDMEKAAAWRRKVGIQDAAGARHKIAAYVALDAGNIDQVATAARAFGFVGIGIEFPAFAMDQFNAGKPWDIARTNTKLEGGHYIPLVGRDANGYFLVITWGKIQRVTSAFLAKYMDEGIAYMSTEVLYNGVNIDGLNQVKMLDNLRHITSVRAPAPSATVPHVPSKPRLPAKKAAPAKAAKKAPAKKAPAKNSSARKGTRR